jgi:hypothetical protein
MGERLENEPVLIADTLHYGRVHTSVQVTAMAVHLEEREKVSR